MLQALLARVRQAHTAELEGGEEAEAGFTLIELMVVLLILAILMAIAIPTFLGVTSGANDRAAQSNLTNALTEASAIYQSNSQSFSNLSTSTFNSSAPEFTWTTVAVSSQNSIDYAVSSDGNALGLSTMSKTGWCWYVLTLQQDETSGIKLTNGSGTSSTASTVTNAGTYYGKYKPTGTTCDALGASQASGSSYATANTLTSAT